MRLAGPHGTWLASRHPLLLNASTTAQWERTAVWITAALARQEKVYYLPAPDDPLAEVAAGVAGSLGKAAGPPPMEVLPADDGPDARSTPARVATWHAELVSRARREGFRGAALTGEGHNPAATTSIVRPRHAARLVAYEQLVDHLTGRLPLRVLCRYNPCERPPDTVQRLLAVHFRNVDDVTWAADLIGGRLRISGEIDVVNLARFRDVVTAAADAGVTTLDLGNVHLLAAAAAGVLAYTATRLARAGRALVIVNPSRIAFETLLVTDLVDHPGITVHG